ncbi:MAG: hypothetical protein OXD43_09270 [Bacteroidetes bacterium]|nr:hypothetical protein [Bacteroidota bacterium]
MPKDDLRGLSGHYRDGSYTMSRLAVFYEIQNSASLSPIGASGQMQHIAAFYVALKVRRKYVQGSGWGLIPARPPICAGTRTHVPETARNSRIRAEMRRKWS